jgi:hypothetical protein
MEKDLAVDEVRFYGTYMRQAEDKPASHQFLVRAQKQSFDSAKRTPKVTFYKGHYSSAGRLCTKSRLKLHSA